MCAVDKAPGPDGYTMAFSSVLIQKRVGTNELRDFRPITGVHQVTAKVLTKRLKKLISKLVNKHQMAFIKGRQIMDAALLVSECIDS